MYQWEFNLPSDIASGRIAEACKGMISAEQMHASQQECWSILENINTAMMSENIRRIVRDKKIFCKYDKLFIYRPLEK